MTMIHAVWDYMRDRQPPRIRFLHIVILLAVISQIIVSNCMEITSGGQISPKLIYFYGTWTHILTGILLLPVAVIFTMILLKEHSIRCFFPYLFGEFEQLKSDFQKLKRFELPEPKAGGLAAIVQGLGLGALFLALLSGLAWFLSWYYIVGWSHSIKELHETLVGLMEAYIIGHGGMGLVHIYFSTS